MLLALPSLAHAGDIDDCRSAAQVTNEARLKSCTAVIDANVASPGDLAYAHYRRALTASADPNPDAAAIMADVSKAIELDPKLMPAYAFRAVGYSRAMQYDKAIADLTQAIALEPGRWALYSLRAMVYAQKKDTGNAIADFQSALGHNPPAASADLIRQRIAALQKAPQ